MAAGTMATAAGAAVMLYYILTRRLAKNAKDGEDPGGDLSKSSRSVRRRRLAGRPAQAPATMLESFVTLSETLRFTYAETLGKWPIGDLAFGINYFMRKQVHTWILESCCFDELKLASFSEFLIYCRKLLACFSVI